MHAKIALALSLICTPCAAQPPTQPSDLDLDRLQGDWRLVSVDDGSGTPPPPEVLKEMTFSIKGDKMPPRKGLFLAQDPATMTVNAETDPKSIDLLEFGQVRQKMADGKPGKMVPNPQALPGIYELEGDELRICLAGPAKSKTRPEEFKTTGKDNEAIMVLRRIKK